ncbi:MAG: SUMF1/EgtB/PvdO family nonheme iron enzyme [Phycisphaerales bacterium]|nr:SUMF1/EgtB/PvdO family nonheme iron enzyme [Phycisphaerales bacterium]
MRISIRAIMWASLSAPLFGCGPGIFIGGVHLAMLATRHEPEKPFWQDVPPAAFRFEMVPVPGDPDAGVKPFWIGRTELTWEAFDVYVYRLDEGDAGRGGADAVTRPTKPYLPPDRGFGHEGYAAISMSYKNAQGFCDWLSARSGRKYRLPTEAEWEAACRAGTKGTYGFVDNPDRLGDYAWFKDNANGTPHPVGRKLPGGYGLVDVQGNVAEWVTGRDGQPVLKGGSYRDAAAALTVDARQPVDKAWNSSDPQVPKSTWWLSDGPFVGFRVVCEGPAEVKGGEK